MRRPLRYKPFGFWGPPRHSFIFPLNFRLITKLLSTLFTLFTCILPRTFIVFIQFLCYCLSTLVAKNNK